MTHRYDFWPWPALDELLQETRAAIEDILSATERSERNRRTDQSRARLRQAVNNACEAADAEFVSAFYTQFIERAGLALSGDNRRLEVWRQFFGNFRPSYPPAPVTPARFLPEPGLASLPLDGSWLLSLGIRLRTAYTSKADSDFHFSNNPIVRDHLTGLPVVHPTGWKGHLRFAARMADVPQHLERRLFGASLGGDRGRAGRLHFFPTFFSAPVQREVVTPLQRSTRTPARGPIDIEVVRPESTCTFCLLYLPHPKGTDWSSSQTAEDIEATTRALELMFLSYGFSAKKTAGWGVTYDTVDDGSLRVRGPDWPAPETVGGAAEVPFLPPDDAYLPLMDGEGGPRSELQKADSTWISNNEFKALSNPPTSLSVYQKFRRWYRDHGQAWERQLARQTSPADILVRTYPVESVSALRRLAAHLGGDLQRDRSGE